MGFCPHLSPLRGGEGTESAVEVGLVRVGRLAYANGGLVFSRIAWAQKISKACLFLNQTPQTLLVLP